jgi:hypothetical protein
MNNSTVGERQQVRLDASAMGCEAVLPPGAAKVLLQMLRASSQEKHEVHSQPPLAA